MMFEYIGWCESCVVFDVVDWGSMLLFGIFLKSSLNSPDFGMFVCQNVQWAGVRG